MATLRKSDFDLLELQIENSKGVMVSKEDVLLILHNKLKEIDAKSQFIVDQFDGAFIKELINEINRLT